MQSLTSLIDMKTIAMAQVTAKMNWESIVFHHAGDESVDRCVFGVDMLQEFAEGVALVSLIGQELHIVVAVHSACVRPLSVDGEMLGLDVWKLYSPLAAFQSFLS
ncbi:hypothetical protein PMIN02_004942 [Paraphaeosphaeria minitans]